VLTDISGRIYRPLIFFILYMRKIFIVISCLLVSIFAVAQEPKGKEKEVDEIIDELFNEGEVLDELMASLSNFQLLYFSVDYNSDTYFSGRDIEIDQYNIRPQISYMHSKGFFTSVSGVYYSEFEPTWDFTTITLGYGKSIGKNKTLRYYTAYSRYFYEGDVANPYTNTLNMGLSIRNKKRTLGTQLSVGYLFGQDQSFQVASRTYLALDLYKTKKTRLQLRPELNVIAGKQTIELVQTYVQQQQLVTNYIENDIFDLINTQINMPLQFRSKSFDLELGYNLNFPTPIGGEEDLKTTGFINFSIAYMIDL
jgi:hypothetical protein